MTVRWLTPLLAALLCAGCETTPESEEPVVDFRGSMEFLQPGLRPEEILFPKFLFLVDFELDQHGRVPNQTLVGAGMKTKLGLSVARGRFSDALSEKGWKTDKMEIEKNAFRLLASFKEERVEIRGVQGRGDTMVFLLYEPDPNNVKKIF